MIMEPKYRDKLKSLVDKANHLIKSRGEYFTDGAKLAVSDMVKDAVLALEGKDQLPFVRNREFYVPREEEAILFATKRFTMAPTYNVDDKVFYNYGLESSLEWFEKQDIFYDGKEKLIEKADFVTLKAQELLNDSICGKVVGNYNFAAGEKLKCSIEAVKVAKDDMNIDNNCDVLALAIVDCFNKIRDYRYSRILRTDIDPSSTLFLTREDLEKVKGNAVSDPLIKPQYDEIKRIASCYSLEYIQKSELLMDEKVDYNQINKEFYAWSSTDKIVNFTAPDKAVKASFSFILPSEENEEQGLGHVWIDNLEILSATGGSIEIMNTGFDEGESTPLHWKAKVLTGKPIMKWEGIYPYCGGGDRITTTAANTSSEDAFNYEKGISKHSIYICNPTRKDEGAWTYDKDILVQGGTGYTLTFLAKIDGKLKKGLKTIITYKDELDNVVDVYEYYFSRKSTLKNSCYELTMQCDAIEYAFTSDVSYALKAKKEILFTLNDFCQGTEHWLVTNLRPEGSDFYGAVQGGRLLCSIASTYSLIKEANVFTIEEKEHFYAMVEYMLRYMLDLRDRTELSPRAAQYGSGNWQTDMCAGVGFMMAVLTDFPNRKTWFYNANAVLKAQLDLNVNPDSSWPESIRYHHAALERFAGYAKVIENVMGDNWFETTSISRMFGYSLNLQTPAYEFFDNHIGTPPFGDHALGGGSEFGSYGTYLGDIAKVDKNLADKMYHTWSLAGKPFKKFWGEGIAIDNIFGVGNSYVPSSKLYLESTKDFVNAGIYLFRKNFGLINQSYFAIMSSPKKIGHGHLDQGSFMIYKNSIPIVMDSGIEGYFDSSTSWHISSYSHACLQFATKKTNIESTGNGVINLSGGTYSLRRGWVDVPKTSKVIECKLGSEMDTITIEIKNPEGKGKHVRQVCYLKQPDLYIIRDTVEDFEGEILFNLPVASKNSTINSNRIHSEGIYGIDLETVFLSKVNDIRLEKGRSTEFFESENINMMDYIRATADSKAGFLTLIYPKVKGQKKLDITKQGSGNIIIEGEDKKVELVINKEKFSVSYLNKSLKL